MLSLFGITKIYDTGGETVAALKGVDMHFRRHEFVSILGPSGCGKTTMLNIVGGLDQYTDGDMLIDGISTKNYTDRDWDAYRNHRIGFVFQSYQLITHQTVLANVELALTLSGVSKAERRRRATEALEKVGLGDQLKKKPGQMSGGQMQRVAIARALVNNPEILLADEPTGALDTQTSQQVMDLLKEIAKDKLVIMVTHNPELAEQYSTRIIRLRDGVMISDSHPYTAEEAMSEVAEHQAQMAEKQPLKDQVKEAEAKQATPRAKKAKKSKKERTSMSFWTALTLSFNNLLTKKTRTMLTSFAGSIGIIGIALILALSNGIQLYIDRVEEDALSSYPLSIDAVTMDSAEILASLVGNAEGRGEYKEGYVYSSPVVLQMIKAVLGGMKKNDLASFKNYLESDECGILDPDVATVVYQYGVTPYIWHTAKDDAGNDKIVQANPSYMLEGLMNGMPMDLPLFSQLLDNPELLSAQFDLLEGEWPDAYNEVVIVTDSNTQINDLYLYALGIKDQDELSEKWGQIWAGGDPVIEEEEYTYAELMQEQFTVIVAGDLFVYDEAAGHYVDKTTDLNFVKGLINGAGQPGSHAVNLKISGIIRPKPDATATSISGVIGYTSALTDYLIEQGQNMDVVKAQLQNPHLDVLTGLPFRTGLSSGPSDTDKVNQITQILTPAGQSHEELREMWKGWLSAQLSQVRTQKAAQTILYMHASRKNAELEMLKNNPDYTDEQKQEMAQTAADKMLIKYFALALGANADQVGDLLAGSGGMMFEKEQLQNPALVEMMIGRMYDTSAAAEKQELMQSITGMYVMVATGFGFGDDPIFAQTGLLTTLEQDVEKASADIDAISDGDLPGAYTAALKALDQATLIQLWDERYGQVSENTYEMNLETIGAANKEQPTAIYIYPVSFDQKQYVVDQIEKYNGTKENVDDKIVYTDYIGVLFSSISMILNIITYVLVAFVAISLVVSSIMIGIITYISVLERTKEIGILRAIGASKRDVSRVFNAETMIVGFVAGLMGIVATLLLMIPINAIIRSLSGVSTIGADLPFVAALALIFISMGLTLIAGLVPSRVAAKKDPVEALRTE